MRTAINVDKSSLAENECIRNLIYAVLVLLLRQRRLLKLHQQMNQKRAFLMNLPNGKGSLQKKRKRNIRME